MSSDINVTMSKDETHEEVQAKQEVEVNLDKTPKRLWSKTGMKLLPPSYLNVIIIVNDYSDFWELDR